MTEEQAQKKRGRAPQVVTDPIDLALLSEVGELTIRIHEAQAEVKRSAILRRERLHALRGRGVTLRVISEHTGITANSVYKDLVKP